jgi:hypothetical protein
MASNVSTKKRTATPEDMKRLITHYEFMASAMGRDKHLATMQKLYKARVKQAQQVVTLRKTNAAKADCVEESLFTAEFAEMKESWEKWAVRFDGTATVEVSGDVITIAHTSSRERKTGLTPKALVLLGINHITVSDGAGNIVSLDDQIAEVHETRGHDELSPEEQTEGWLEMLESLDGKPVADHTRKVINGEVSLLADGPRGYATMRQQIFGREMRQARSGQMMNAQFRQIVQALSSKPAA